VTQTLMEECGYCVENSALSVHFPLFIFWYVVDCEPAGASN